MFERIPHVGTGPRVLVVDDDPALLRATARQLRSGGAQVTECASGPAAAELVEAGAFDVIVSDIDMPGLSGIELLALLRKRGIEAPVVLVTGSPSMDTAVQAVEHGAFKYLTKPFDAADLVAAVDRAASRAAGSVTRASVSAGVVLASRYRVVRLIGEGGMSQVWQATQLHTNREVAVKVLHAGLNAHADMRERLLREALASNRVGHPNVVDVLDAFELPDGTPVLVMPLLRGQTLTARLGRAPGPAALVDVANLLLPVVSAVGTAHARGVVHRDLKPDNIFVCDEDPPTIKVLDFGIAKLVAADLDVHALTATGALVGTPGYMSPEQAVGERDIDHRADIWSLGAVLYEALAGVRPVQVDSVGEMAKVLFTETIPSLAGRAPSLPTALTALVDRMLARDREGRPADLREAHAELSRHATVKAPAFGPPAAIRPEPVSGVVATANAALGAANTEYAPAAAKQRSA
jgi:CheY-like chemotaxis protein